MKRTIILLLCTIIVLAVGCSRTEPLPAEDPTEGSTASTAEATDAVPALTEPATEPDDYEGTRYCFNYHRCAVSANSDTYILETDNTIYYLSNNIMYFSDKDYKDFMPLCPKPECDHSGIDCNAYIDSIGGFWIYDHYIYYVSYGLNGRDASEVNVKEASLWRMRFDGTQHEKVFEFEAPDFGFTPMRTDWQFLFSDKYLTVYCYCRKYAADTSYGFATGLLKLDNMEYIERERYDKYDPCEHQTENDLGGNIMFCEGPLYYCLNCVYTGTSPSDRRYRITTNNVETDEYMLIADLDELPAYLEGLFMKKDGDILYMPYLDAEGRKSVHVVDLETGEDTVTAEGDLDTLRVSQFDWKNGWLCGVYRDPGLDPKNSGFYVYDAEGHILESATCEGLPEEALYLDIFLQTDSYFFAAPLPHDEDGNVKALDASTIPTWYIDKSEIGTGSLAWRRWAPED